MADGPAPPARHPGQAPRPPRRLHGLLLHPPPAPLPAPPRHPLRRPAQSRPGNRTADTIDTNGTVALRHAGQLYHLGIGRTHARTHVIMLIQDPHVRIINAARAELLRQLTLDPAPTTKPTGNPSRPKRQTP
jgi:hypothetical protein